MEQQEPSAELPDTSESTPHVGDDGKASTEYVPLQVVPLRPPEAESSAAPPAQRAPVSRSACVTGGASGGALCAYALTLPEPYRSWVSIGSAGLSAAITAYWPAFYDWSLCQFKSLLEDIKLKRAKSGLLKMRRELKERLKDRSLSPQAKQDTQENLAKIEKTIAGIDKKRIHKHLYPDLHTC
jgi:hypothetical protein